MDGRERTEVPHLGRTNRCVEVGARPGTHIGGTGRIDAGLLDEGGPRPTGRLIGRHFRTPRSLLSELRLRRELHRRRGPDHPGEVLPGCDDDPRSGRGDLLPPGGGELLSSGGGEPPSHGGEELPSHGGRQACDCMSPLPDVRRPPGEDVQPDLSSRRCVLSPSGDLVADAMDELLDRWLTAVDLDLPSDVTVNLSGVEVVDPYGWGALRFLQACLERRGVPCLICGLPRRAMSSPS